GHGADVLIERLDLIVQHQCVMDGLPVEITVPHDFRSAKHLGIERKRTIHVLYGHAEVLEAPNPLAERRTVPARSCPLRLKGRRVSRRCVSNEAGDRYRACSSNDISTCQRMSCLSAHGVYSFESVDARGA